MTDTSHFETLLRNRQRELHKRLHAIETDLDKPADADSEERATEREGDEVLESLGQAGLSELKAIDAALDRIKAGTYGSCVKCGEPIARGRLDIVPHAALCQECIRPG